MEKVAFFLIKNLCNFLTWFAVNKSKQTKNIMKYKPNHEYTFVTPNQNDFMVWFDENGQPISIYTYRDSGVHGLSLAKWSSNLNPLFIHCPKNSLQKTWEFLSKNAVTLD